MRLLGKTQTWRYALVAFGFTGLLWAVHRESSELFEAKRLQRSSREEHGGDPYRPVIDSDDGVPLVVTQTNSMDEKNRGGTEDPWSSGVTEEGLPGCWGRMLGVDGAVKEAPEGTMRAGCTAVAKKGWESAKLRVDTDIRRPIFSFGGREAKGETLRYAHMAGCAKIWKTRL